MISIAHIVNPIPVNPDSDLFIAQPVTFSTMDIAREFSGDCVQVHLHAVQMQDEERVSFPRSFVRVPDITQSVSDIKYFKQKRKLPLIRDILDRLYAASNADFMIYTNVDIALQPYFYLVVSRIIEQGCDAFIINRRTIPGKYKTVRDIPLMYAEPGENHPGWDCFIFHKSLYPKFQLGQVCIGSGWFGRAMIINMATFAKNFRIFTDMRATFHIGNDQIWKNPLFEDYIEHNKNECREIMMDFSNRYGPFRHKILRRFFSKMET